MEKRSAWKLAVLTKAGVLSAAILAFSFHDELSKIYYNITERTSVVSEGFYKSPSSLAAEWETNDRGEIETYLVNVESGAKQEIMYDMLPANRTMIKGLKQRYEHPDPFNDRLAEYEDLTNDLLYAANEELSKGRAPEIEDLDSLISNAVRVFKAANEHAYGANFSDESVPLSEVELVVEQNYLEENDLYLTRGFERVKVTPQLFSGDGKEMTLDFGKYEKMLGKNSQKAITRMFKDYLDQQYFEYKMSLKN